MAETGANKLIEEIKTVIAEHQEKGEVLKKEAATLRELRNPETVEQSNDKGKGKAPQRENSPSSDANLEDDDLPKTPAGVEHGIKRRALQQRLRECNVTLHRVKFLQGDVYHVLGESHSTMEDSAYATAEEIRRGLLKSECHLTFSSYLLMVDLNSNGRSSHASDGGSDETCCSQGTHQGKLARPNPLLRQGRDQILRVGA